MQQATAAFPTWQIRPRRKARESALPGSPSDGYSSLSFERMFDWHEEATVRASAAARARESLLGPSSQRLEVGLLGARTAAILRRIIGGERIEDVDRVILTRAMDVMNATADAVEGITESGHARPSSQVLGFGAMAFTLESAAGSVPPSDLPRFLRGVAVSLETLREHADVSVAKRTLPIFALLADLATRSAGTSGEGASSLI